MSVTVRDDDVDAFFDVPFRVYPRDTPYVSPLRSDVRRALDPKRNPLFGADGRGARRVLTAHRDGRPVGRLVAHVHGASNEKFGTADALFGFFDAADDAEAAAALFAEAFAFARAQRATRLTGNFNLTAMQQLGVVTGGFEHAPYADMVWNPPHIPRLLEGLGFRRSFPVTTFEVDVGAVDLAALRSPAATARRADPALRWERLRARDFDRVLEEIRAVLNDGFAHNPMFVPLTAAEMRFQAADLSHLLDPAITALVHDAEGPAGVVLCIPDLNPLLRAMKSRLSLLAPWHLLAHKRRRDRAVIIFYSVARRRQNQGLNAAMLVEVLTALRTRGYRRLGITWIGDENRASLRQVAKLGARPLHRLHLFTAPVPPAGA